MIYNTPEIAWAYEIEMINTIAFGVNNDMFLVGSTDQTD